MSLEQQLAENTAALRELIAVLRDRPMQAPSMQPATDALSTAAAAPLPTAPVAEPAGFPAPTTAFAQPAPTAPAPAATVAPLTAAPAAVGERDARGTQGEPREDEGATQEGVAVGIGQRQRDDVDAVDRAARPPACGVLRQIEPRERVRAADHRHTMPAPHQRPRELIGARARGARRRREMLMEVEEAHLVQGTSRHVGTGTRGDRK